MSYGARTNMPYGVCTNTCPVVFHRHALCGAPGQPCLPAHLHGLDGLELVVHLRGQPPNG